MQIEQYQRFYELEDKHWWFVGMRDIFYRSISGIYREDANLKILDVGCGTGIIIKDLERFGKVVGIDIEDAALKFCQQRNIGKICLGDGVNLPFKDATFDLVTVFSVVEHIQDDAGFIQELSRSCRDNGRIILSTSAFNFLWNEHDVINEHKRRYTKSRLEALFRGQNLHIEKITYTNFILFPLILLGIILKNMLRCLFGSMVDRFYSTPQLANKLLILILKLESLILSRFNFPFGVSLLCIARKTKKINC